MPNAYGRLPHTWDRRDFLAQPTVPYTGQFVDVSSGFGWDPWDQGQLGSCVSHGSSAALTFAQLKAGLPVEDPSRLFHYFAARLRAGYDTSQDTGLEIRDGIDSLAKDGVPPTPDWPYDTSKFTQRPPMTAWTDATSYEAVKYGAVAPTAVDAMVASGFPVVIGFDVYESFEGDQNASSGIMPIPGKGEQLIGGHCVVICSTVKDGADLGGGAVAGQLYRKCRNSWGTGWGQGGYFWYPDAAMKYASDFWQVTTASTPGPQPKPPQPQPPVDSNAKFAAVAVPWVHRHHTTIAGNEKMKEATEVWLHEQGFLK